MLPTWEYNRQLVFDPVPHNEMGGRLHGDEYRNGCQVHTGVDGVLYRMGCDGWELVSVFYRGPWTLLTFKRVKEAT